MSLPLIIKPDAEQISPMREMYAIVERGARLGLLDRFPYVVCYRVGRLSRKAPSPVVETSTLAPAAAVAWNEEMAMAPRPKDLVLPSQYSQAALLAWEVFP